MNLPATTIALAFGLAFVAGPALADFARIEGARIQRIGTGWTISVTLRHPDSGWEHYADAWEVLTPRGKSLGKRVLLHPHEKEQPFTRALPGVIIPAGLRTLVIRAHCSRDGWGPRTFRLELP